MTTHHPGGNGGGDTQSLAIHNPCGNSGNSGNDGNHVVDMPEISAPHPSGNSENSLVEMFWVQPKPKRK